MAQSKRRYLDHDWDSMINLRKKNRISKGAKLRTDEKKAPADEKIYRMQPAKKYRVDDKVTRRVPMRTKSGGIEGHGEHETAGIAMTLDAMQRAEYRKQPKTSRAKTTIKMKGKTSRDVEQRIMNMSSEKIAKEIVQ
jgi:hypothetical protein